MNANPHEIRPAKASTASKAQYVRKLGLHHFSHLRTIAEGLDIVQSAKRYLGVEHGHQAKTAHQQTVDAIRAVARRHNEPAWRLIGLVIHVEMDASQPSLEEFMEERSLDGWSEADIAAMYAEVHPPQGKGNYKISRRTKLRERQMALLKRLEQLAAETPSPTDLVSGWFDEVTAQKLISAGILTLADLNQKIATGGRWYRTLPAIGEHKARRIATHLATLLPRHIAPPKPVLALATSPSLFASPFTAPFASPLASPFSALPSTNVGLIANGSALLHPLPASGTDGRLLNARSDQEAVEAWVSARAGALPTVTVYRREAHRLMLWLQYERWGKTLSQMQIEDCRDYMAFLQDIPAKWSSRTHAAPGQPGWAPFRGPLSHKSQRQAVVIIASLFTWLQSAQYLTQNPWPLINQKTGDDRAEQMMDTKALSEAAFTEVISYVLSQAPSPSRSRILFILRFVESVGLRSAELINGKLGDLRLEPEGWMMQVHGKGSKNRVAAIPGQAFDALQNYLESRGLGGIEHAPATAPLLASALDPMEPVGYQALYEHVKGWISKAVAASALPSNERSSLAGATTHWLRHTFGTRAVAREVPLDVIQAQMGHASIQTTMGIYGRAPIKRRAEELAKAFG
jgi:integrase